MKLFFFIIFIIIIPIISGLSWQSFLQFLQTITRGASSRVRSQAVRESVKGIGSNLVGGVVGGATVEIASKVFENKSMFINTL